MEEWIKAAARNHPDKHYQMRAGQLMELLQAADEPQADLAALFAAAYNAGYQRGRNYERNHRKSLAAIKRALLWDAGQEQDNRQQLLDLFREQTTLDDAAELIGVFDDKMKEAAALDPDAAAYFNGMSMGERAAWAVKEAYCIGQVQGHVQAQDVIRNTLADLAQQEG